MTDYKTDDEKVEELKAWWKENGSSVIAGIALAVAGLFGWEYWKDWKADTSMEASALYTQVNKTADNNFTQALADVKKLQSDYSSTPYAAIASLKAAQHYAQQGEYEQAVNSLRWVIDHGEKDSFQDVARLRLARVMLAMQKPDEAMKLAGQKYPAAYQSLLEELKGDIYVAKNETDKARSAYDKAILSSGGSSDLLKMKRDNLGDGV